MWCGTPVQGNTCRNLRVKGARQPQAAVPEPPNDEIPYVALTHAPFTHFNFAEEAPQKGGQRHSQAG